MRTHFTPLLLRPTLAAIRLADRLKRAVTRPALATDERGEIFVWLLLLGLIATVTVAVFALLWPVMRDAVVSWADKFRTAVTSWTPPQIQ